MSFLSRRRVAAVGAAAAVACGTLAVATPAYASLPQPITCKNKKSGDVATFYIHFTLGKNRTRHVNYITYNIKKKYAKSRNKNNISFKDYGVNPTKEWENRDNGMGDGKTRHLLTPAKKDISYTRHQQSMYMYVTFDHPGDDPSCSSGPVYW
ncbi:hypothetical protein NE236_14540 [Actinoallomurus purpureus]|uniref:hypothetical protein n=1 Tax=Actinoallomurus purpureus TaxID=478114 RepID=UPI0020937515|nr:hypothetical protein [Actinoallomurus purpureus]MCO6006208.1 hypothetical protein [Actinoallomurus purpureus]